jgi:hypothetical protein
MTHSAQEALRAALLTQGDANTQGQAAMTAARDRLGTYANSSKPEGVLTVGSTYGQCDSTNGTSGGALDICTNVTSNAYPACSSGVGNCLVITLGYDYAKNSIINMPLIDMFIPPQIKVTASQRMS